MKKESPKSVILSNIPNFLTISRIILAFVVIYMIFDQYDVISIVVVFGIAASTDFFDGQLARRFNWVSEFGRRTDMIADRFLWVGTTLAFVISFGRNGMLSGYVGIQLLLIMSREIVSAPFALIAFFSGNPLPKVRYIGKATTFLQAFALPALILSIYYPVFLYVSIPLSIAVGITGFLSGMYYIKDTKPKERKNK